MWAKLDDELFNHPKIATAGRKIGGRNGGAVALGFYTAALLWTNKYLTDGLIPEDAMRTWTFADKPLAIADALTRARLFEKVKGGYRIHDFHEYNPAAADIRKKRKEDRLRKQAARANGHA